MKRLDYIICIICIVLIAVDAGFVCRLPCWMMCGGRLALFIYLIRRHTCKRVGGRFSKILGTSSKNRKETPSGLHWRCADGSLDSLCR
jgi:hypothetical protein